MTANSNLMFLSHVSSVPSGPTSRRSERCETAEYKATPPGVFQITPAIPPRHQPPVGVDIFINFDSVYFYRSQRATFPSRGLLLGARRTRHRRKQCQRCRFCSVRLDTVTFTWNVHPARFALVRSEPPGRFQAFIWRTFGFGTFGREQQTLRRIVLLVPAGSANPSAGGDSGFGNARPELVEWRSGSFLNYELTGEPAVIGAGLADIVRQQCMLRIEPDPVCTNADQISYRERIRYHLYARKYKKAYALKTIPSN